MGELPTLLFSPRGRVGRLRFTGGILTLVLAFLVSFAFLESMVGRAATWVLYPPLFWAAFALGMKRLHDRGASAWWCLVAAVPVLGPLWLAFSLFVRPGSSGENRYGPDPGDDVRDFLEVDIHQTGPSRQG